MAVWHYLKQKWSVLASEPLVLGLVLLWLFARLLNVVRKTVNENQQIEIRVLKDVIIIRKADDIHLEPPVKDRTPVEGV